LSTGSETPLRIVTFGDIEAGFWGAAWDGVEGAGVVAGSVGSATIEGSEAAGPWKVRVHETNLEVVPVGDAVMYPSGGFDQLCRLSAGNVDCFGRRALQTQIGSPGLDSMRDVSCWFGTERGLALSSQRPARRRGHDDDFVQAAILDVAGEEEVADPRLSTTYAEGGAPVRFGLELWIGGDDESEQYPRRAAGEAASSPTVSTGPRLEVAVAPFRCHSRGEDGTGIYLLIRPR
jgi:hypothetical protein